MRIESGPRYLTSQGAQVLPVGRQLSAPRAEVPVPFGPRGQGLPLGRLQLPTQGEEGHAERQLPAQSEEIRLRGGRTGLG